METKQGNNRRGILDIWTQTEKYNWYRTAHEILSYLKTWLKQTEYKLENLSELRLERSLWIMLSKMKLIVMMENSRKIQNR